MRCGGSVDRRARGPAERWRPACLALAIARNSPRDASRCAAVSPAFRAATDSDHIWSRFLPVDILQHIPSAVVSTNKKKKEAYLALCDAAGAAAIGKDGGCKVWLDRATGAKC
ncbi:hypothetical protein BAE44_0015619 [Dichanthelium oligosanthes]|uniref:F-box domain-containing protein n=1 Tax=Dichanthelium oligosanthes TaxID=888268 RepID=A0A1E5VDY7_9POAL|nr:hypothetical protein BAE44_0015619 [Dichanthelium oligosanthes]